MSIRPAAVAGLFYPQNKTDLNFMLSGILPHSSSTHPKALIVPHAGYIYSGGIAGQGYTLLEKGEPFDRVCLFGPNHRVPLEGCAVPEHSFFSTPLGELPVDQKAVAELLKRPEVMASDAVHAQEHCLEVQLPFLQYLQINAPIVPVVVGECSASVVADMIEPLLSDPKTLVIISTDLSHFHTYENARQIDAHTDLKIMNADHDIKPTEACGCHALNGFLLAVKRQSMMIKKVALGNSGDTAGDKSRVVGYGCYVVY